VVGASDGLGCPTRFFVHNATQGMLEMKIETVVKAKASHGNLCLERKAGQSFRIGDATVTVVKIVGNRVGLAIQADRSIPIVRTEIERKA
jgi:carbon storage regulator CsrA